jgi:hypothetical protein
LANFPLAYCGLKIITSLRSVSLTFSDWMDALHYIGSDSSYNNAFYESYEEIRQSEVNWSVRSGGK